MAPTADKARIEATVDRLLLPAGPCGRSDLGDGRPPAGVPGRTLLGDSLYADWESANLRRLRPKDVAKSVRRWNR